MKKETSLSDKFHFGDEGITESGDRYYIEEDVKEAVQKLKDAADKAMDEAIEEMAPPVCSSALWEFKDNFKLEIDRIFGPKLIEEGKGNE